MGSDPIYFKSEARYGESLRIEMAATDFHKYGCDVVYRISSTADQRLIALTKTAHLHYDANYQKLLLSPEGFRKKLLGN